MRDRLTRLLSLAPLLGALFAPPASAYVLQDRWDVTATNGFTGAMGTPVTLTWSFAPNGIIIPTGVANNLLTFLDANWGAGPGGNNLTQRPWFPIFAQSYGRLSELSGVTFLYKPQDDGVAFSNSMSAAGGAARGDIRLGGKSYGGASALATSFFPDYGEMMINTDSINLNDPANNQRRFRNVIMHEAMHGLGAHHVVSTGSQFLLEPVLNTAFDGPQLDDILALQRLYGDSYEKNGGNDTHLAATPLGALTAANLLVKGTNGDSKVVAAAEFDFLSIDDASDIDFFSFTLSDALDVDLTLTPKGAAYQFGPENGSQSPFDSRTVSNLTLALFDSSGVGQIQLADLNGAGDGESILRQLDPGSYFARVTGAASDIQLYEIAIVGSEPEPPILFAPADFNLDGQVDNADLAIWRSGFGAVGTGTHATGDADGNGRVDGADFLAWQRAAGDGGQIVLAARAVPEPSTGALATGALAWATAARRRKTKAA